MRNWLESLVNRLGNAQAVANARAQIDRRHWEIEQVEALVKRLPTAVRRRAA